MWKDLPREWQEAYKLAWLAFCRGSIPIGAIITDASGKTVIAGRNETGENRYPNRRTAHAEMYCMLNIDIEKHPSLKEYHLYTTMEPCPMCMGTIAMGGIRKVHVAARDPYCGALHYIDYDPWIKGKNMEVHLEGGELEAVQIAQQCYYELRRFHGEIRAVVEQFQSNCPRAVESAISLYQERYLDKCAENNAPYCEVYDHICDILKWEDTQKEKTP